MSLGVGVGVGLGRTTAVSLLASSLKPQHRDELGLSVHPVKPVSNGLLPDSTLQPGKCTSNRLVRPGTNGLQGLHLDGKFLTAGDGSLPSTPDPEELGSAELEGETRQLLLDFYLTHSGMCSTNRKLHHALPTMTRVVDGVLVKHQLSFKGMLRRLDLDSQPDSLEILGSLASVVFQDGVCNWGRVVSLVAFGAQVCLRLKEQGREHCIHTVAQRMADYLISEQQQWLISNNSWRGFEQFFHVQDVESVFRGALMALLGCAGVGAGLALILR
ncbi:hypothetical protein DNTS_009873 [Danionella cerebrum]|uniref:Bcl-2 Bcl-2 homology region 1-3 domain-containing protein n=1 Tax=Danionella cerebrum TaxID=2873325 RepID=A0A553NJL2_9TELE|nr:hypothetical protein DNTS_009873 [Danionella translucida]